MRIDPNQGAQAPPESGRAASQRLASAAAQAATGGAPGADQAELSGAHLQVQALTAQALQFPEVRQEKVNALRQVVEDGGYQPGAGQVANAIFDHLMTTAA